MLVFVAMPLPIDMLRCDNEGVSLFSSVHAALLSLRANVWPSSQNQIRVPDCLRAPAGAVPIELRPITLADEQAWGQLRWRNSQWLAPWESGDPMHGAGMTFAQWVVSQRRNERAGSAVVFLIYAESQLVGQISLGAITYGSMRTGVVGYWVDQHHIGRGIAPTAVALLADWAIVAADGPKLHRLEIAILPENQRSQRVAQKLHARYEGTRARYMFINGQWRDHDTYALLAEDAPNGWMNRLISRHTVQ